MLKIKNKPLRQLVKFLIAAVLDVIDFFVANIPIANTLYDLFTTAVLWHTLDDSDNALLTLGELVLPGVPGFGQIDAFLPISTIVTLADITGIDLLNLERAEPK